MKADKGWLLMALAAGAAGGAAATLLARRGRQRRAVVAEHKADLKSWENEGGNLAPAAK
jgi:hypothetical protein